MLLDESLATITERMKGEGGERGERGGGERRGRGPPLGSAVKLLGHTVTHTYKRGLDTH